MRIILTAAAWMALSACTDTDPSVPTTTLDLSIVDFSETQDSSQDTPPLARFAVIGDFGVDSGNEAKVAALVRRWKPDFVLTVGDNNYPRGEAATIDLNIGQHYGEFIGRYQGKFGPGSETNRFWPSLGNHDWYSSTGAQPYLDYFPALPGNGRYYDVELGDIHLFAIDSDVHEPDGIDAQSVQGQWLRRKLAASSSCFNVVTFHHPAYSSGDPIFTQPRMRWPFADWGADLVLMGHQHQYERLNVGGLTYVVDGLGGALNRFGFGAVDPHSEVRYNNDFGALFVEEYDSRLHLEFKDTRGKVIDSFDVGRNCGPRRPLADGGFDADGGFGADSGFGSVGRTD
jgi:hypothetical protein